MMKVALFPIPDCVIFPGMTFPLHVFEPRYRALVKNCAESGMMLGVCHVEKVIKDAKAGQSVHKVLNSNQATYKPVSIFSAGQCVIEKTLQDGRLLVNLHAEVRLRRKQELQTLPFSIHACEEVHDGSLNAQEYRVAEQLKDKVVHRLSAIFMQFPELRETVKSPDWLEKSPARLSFEIFKYLRLSSDLQQQILEDTSPVRRLEAVLSVLNGINKQQ